MSGILISLGAVILVVLVIGFFAMRFLRADDAAADDFDLPGERPMPREDDDRDWRGDGRPARGRSRGGPADGPRLTGDGPRLAAEPPRRFGGRPEREPARDGFGGSDRRPRGGRDGDRGFTDPGFGTAASFNDFDSRNFDRPAGGRGAPREVQADRSPAPRRPAASASRGRGKGRPGEPDWDSMSDVDYWTELASDKSLTNGVQPATAARSDHPATDSRADRPGRDAAAAGREDATALLPARRRPASRGPAESGPLPAASGGRGSADGMRGGRGAMPGSSSRGARPDTGSLPGRRSRDQRSMPAAAGYGDGRGQSADAGVGGLAALARLGTGSGPLPAPLNDDPLTSPSFPAVSAADGRSYHSGRSDAGRPDNGPQNGYPAGGQYPDPAADPMAGYGRPADSARPNGAHSTGAHSTGAHSTGGHSNGHLNGSRANGAHAGGLLSGEPNGLLSGGDPGAGPGGRHKSQASGLLSGGDQGDWAGRYGPAGAAANSTGPGSYHPAQPALPAAPPPVAAPAPAAASYRDYAEPPASGNPYGSYVTPAAEAYPPAANGRADSEPRYEAPYGGSSYLAGQETQQYAQPAGRHLASSSLHAAPVPAAPALPAGSGALHAAPVADPHAGYGNGHGGNGHGAYYGGAPASGYSNGHGSGHNGHAGIPDAHGQQAMPGYPAEPEYPAAGYGTQPYDQTAYLPADSGAAQHDQRGYGTPDSGGYGSDTYGGYPGY